jgi:hypothetical protein
VILSDTGESRVRGYLFVLERSLSLALPREVARDAAREIESHVRERIAAVGASSDERAALEQILAELGPPLRVAQAYWTERTLDEAVVPDAWCRWRARSRISPSPRSEASSPRSGFSSGMLPASRSS